MYNKRRTRDLSTRTATTKGKRNKPRTITHPAEKKMREKERLIGRKGLERDKGRKGEHKELIKRRKSVRKKKKKNS